MVNEQERVLRVCNSFLCSMSATFYGHRHRRDSPDVGAENNIENLSFSHCNSDVHTLKKFLICVAWSAV